jgi:hypothetical protein
VTIAGGSCGENSLLSKRRSRFCKSLFTDKKPVRIHLERPQQRADEQPLQYLNKDQRDNRR